MSRRERERERERGRPRTALFALALALMAGRAAAVDDPPYGVTCPVVPHSSPDPGTFEHRWAGRIQDPFTLDGEEVWIGEDGGRIRHRDPATGDWSFQPVPYEVRGTVRRLHFLDDGLTGWAVSSDGWVLHTTVGGSEWTAIARIPALPATVQITEGAQEWEELYDVWFAPNGQDGWLAALRGILYTEDGGICWTPADLVDAGASPPLTLGPNQIESLHLELYGLDIRTGGSFQPCAELCEELCPGECPEPCPPTDFLGLVVGQPGIVLRSTDQGRTWYLTLDWNDICATLSGGCLADACGHISVPPWFELWDVELRDHPTERLALVVGGVGNGCGLALSSTDDGCSWTRELHECEAAGAGVDCTTCEYTPVPCDPTVPAYRLTDFKALYGVGIFDADGTAVASGYTGQHLRREEVLDGTGMPTGVFVWRDRSEHGEWTDAPDDVTIFPLYGATVPDYPPVELSGRAWITGVGGHVRVTNDGGDAWEHEPDLTGNPYRISAAWFKIDPTNGAQVGWQVGQFFRLASSADGGATWTESLPPRIYPEGSTYHDITFAGDGRQGVAVGSYVPDGPDPGTLDEGPRIVWTDDFGAGGWAEVPNTSIEYTPASEATEHLRSHLLAVTWAKDAANLEFWAVGQKGLVMRSPNGGTTWKQSALSVTNPLGLTLHGVAAAGPGAIVLVGARAGGPNPGGRAFRHQGGTWSEIPIQTNPSGSITLLSDVTALGTAVYAVGRREVVIGDDTVRTGVVLKYNATTQVFEDLAGPYAPAEIEDCLFAQGDLREDVLTEVELAPNGDLWVGGTCGRVWQRIQATGQWIEHKSQTLADIRSMNFITSDLGFVAAHGGPGINQVLIRYQSQ